MIKHSRHHYIDSAFVYGLAVLSVIVISNLSPYILKKHYITPPHIPSKPIPRVLFNQSAFSQVHIRGKAYVVYDVVDGKMLAGENATTTLPLASITKMMTLITARSRYGKDTPITITPGSMDGEYDLGLRKGQVWTLDNLLKYTLTISSNDGAQEIADTLGGRSTFVREMNEDALKLGFTTLHFTHPAGLDEHGQFGGVGSPLEVAKLFVIAYNRYPDVLDVTTKRRLNVMSSTGRLTGVPNTNQDIPNIEGAVASKTGFTDGAGGNLGVIVDPVIGHPVVLIVLGSTHEDRFSDIETLSRALRKSIGN